MSRFISTISANLDHICVIYNHFSTTLLYLLSFAHDNLNRYFRLSYDILK
jgi:hypothetical protein